MRRGTLVRLVAVGLAAAAVAVAVAIFVPWLPEQASKERERIDLVFWVATGICIFVFGIVAGVTLYAVWKFRAAPDDDSDGPPIHGNTALEILWTAVPAVLVTVIAVVSAVALAKNDSLPSNRLVSKAGALVIRARIGALKGDPGVLAERLELIKPCENSEGRKAAYLVVPRKLPLDEWVKVAQRGSQTQLGARSEFRTDNRRPSARV